MTEISPPQAGTPGGAALAAMNSDDFEALVVEQRPHPVTRDGKTIEIDDSVLLARRR